MVAALAQMPGLSFIVSVFGSWSIIGSSRGGGEGPRIRSPQRFFCWRCQSASYFPCLASVGQCSSFVVRSGVMDPFQIIHGLNGLGRGISVKRVFTYCTCRRTEREYVGHRAERRRFRDRQAGRQAGNNRVWSRPRPCLLGFGRRDPNCIWKS